MKKQVSQTKKVSVLRASMYVAVLIGLAGFLIFSILAAITFGNADLSLKDVYSVIVYELFHIKSLSAYAEGAIHDVVWLIRLPRVLLALAVGMALSVCGVVMQAIVQNPLADPYFHFLPTNTCIMFLSNSKITNTIIWFPIHFYHFTWFAIKIFF